MKLNGFLRSALLCGPVMTLYSSPVYAQSGAETSAMNDGTIIVTARRVEERLQDVPLSITVFDQDAIDKRNFVTGQDLALYTPSLEVSTQQGSTNTSFTLRGFVQDQGTQPTVGAYFAEAVALRGGINSLFAGDGPAAGSFFDLQNIQVLKGPQGTLFGRNTTGGAVLVVPQRPTYNYEGYVEAGLGNYDMMRLQAVLNAPLADWARMRIGFDRQKRDGYVRNTGGVGPDRFGDVDYWSLRGSLVLDLAADVENYTVVTYNRSDVTGDVQSLRGCVDGTRFSLLSCAQQDAQLARGDGFWTAQTSQENVFSDTKQWQVVNRLNWQVSDNLSVNNITSYGEVTQDYSNPLFGTLFDASVLNPALPEGTYIDFVGVQPKPGSHFSDQWTGSNEFRLTGNLFNGALNWQGGVYLEKSAPLSTSTTYSSGLLDCADLGSLTCANPPILFISPTTAIGIGSVGETTQRNTYKNAGVYFQGDFSLTDRLKLTGGIRYTWDEINSFVAVQTLRYPTSTTQTQPNATACRDASLTVPCHVNVTQKSNAPTWLVGLDYKATDDVLVYAKYARGYRGGGVNPTLPAPINIFSAEKLDSYEAGIKTSFNGSVRGYFNLSGFYNTLTNQQLKTAFINVENSAILIAGAVNAGKTRIYGLEAEASVSPVEGFQLDAHYSYLKGTIRSVDFSAIPPPEETGFFTPGGFIPGDPTAFTPHHKLSATGTFTVPLDDDMGTFSLGTTVTYTTKQVSNYNTRNPDGSLGTLAFIPARTLVNVNAGWEGVGGTPIDLSLFATNLLNKKYISYVQLLNISIGADSFQLGQPRMIGARVRYTFGK